MLLKGLNHVAVITNDATRLNDFYRDVFDAEILRDGPEPLPDREGPRLSIIKIGDWAELNVFEIAVNTEAGRSSFLPVRGPDLRSADCVYIEGYTRYPAGTAAAAKSAFLVASPPVPGATTWPATVVVGSQTQYAHTTSAGMFEAVRSVSGKRRERVVVTRGRQGADAYASSGEVHVDAVAAGRCPDLLCL